MTENRSSLLLKLLLLVILVSACGSPKKIRYLNEIGDSEIRSRYEYTESVIQKNDLLNIFISSGVNPEASRIFNSASAGEGESIGETGRPVTVSGYLVDLEGNIEIPVLGKIQSAGVDG